MVSYATSFYSGSFMLSLRFSKFLTFKNFMVKIEFSHRIVRKIQYPVLPLKATNTCWKVSKPFFPNSVLNLKLCSLFHRSYKNSQVKSKVCRIYGGKNLKLPLISIDNQT